MSRQGGPRIKLSPKVSPRGSPRVVSPIQGPMRATLPLSVVCKEDAPVFQGRRSPGARIYARSDRPQQPTAPIRRSASLDAMYRFWGRSFPIDGIFPCKTRATQTENTADRLGTAESLTDEVRRLFTPRTHHQSLSPGSKAGASHGSEEGLNLEIESYTGNPSCATLQEPIPEGRKAPISDLLKKPSNVDFSPNQIGSDESGDSDQESEVDFVKQKMTFSASLPRDSGLLPTSQVTRTLTVPVKLTPSAFFNLQPSSHSAFESPKQKDKVNEAKEETRRSEEEDDKSPKVPQD